MFRNKKASCHFMHGGSRLSTGILMFSLFYLMPSLALISAGTASLCTRMFIVL